MMYHLPLAAFRIFSLLLGSCSMSMLPLSVVLTVFILLWIHCIPKLMCFNQIAKFSTIISASIFLLLLFSFTFTPITYMIECLMLTRDLWHCAFFFSFPPFLLWNRFFFFNWSNFRLVDSFFSHLRSEVHP